VPRNGNTGFTTEEDSRMRTISVDEAMRPNIASELTSLDVLAAREMPRPPGKKSRPRLKHFGGLTSS
jgi:hypothetical protein